MAADLSFFAFFAPVAAFLIVWVIVYALLSKLDLIKNVWVNLLLAFVVATIFVSGAGAIEYVNTITPWFAMLVVSLVFLMILVAFIGEPVKSMQKGIGVAFIIALFAIFIISAFVIFAGFIVNYLPGPEFGSGVDSQTFFFFRWLYSPKVAGAILLLVSAGITSWLITRKTK